MAVTEAERAAFVARVRQQRLDAGHPPFITAEKVYRILDGILSTRRPSEPEERAHGESEATTATR